MGKPKFLGNTMMFLKKPTWLTLATLSLMLICAAAQLEGHSCSRRRLGPIKDFLAATKEKWNLWRAKRRAGKHGQRTTQPKKVRRKSWSHGDRVPSPQPLTRASSTTPIRSRREPKRVIATRCVPKPRAKPKVVHKSNQTSSRRNSWSGTWKHGRASTDSSTRSQPQKRVPKPRQLNPTPKQPVVPQSNPAQAWTGLSPKRLNRLWAIQHALDEGRSHLKRIYESGKKYLTGGDARQKKLEEIFETARKDFQEYLSDHSPDELVSKTRYPVSGLWSFKVGITISSKTSCLEEAHRNLRKEWLLRYLNKLKLDAGSIKTKVRDLLQEKPFHQYGDYKTSLDLFNEFLDENSEEKLSEKLRGYSDSYFTREGDKLIANLRAAWSNYYHDPAKHKKKTKASPQAKRAKAKPTGSSSKNTKPSKPKSPPQKSSKSSSRRSPAKPPTAAKIKGKQSGCTHYDTFGVDRKADVATIRAAYRKLYVKVHTAGAKGDAARQYKMLGNAWKVLNDPKKREAYDASLRSAVTAKRP